jgi:hypothetical protein
MHVYVTCQPSGEGEQRCAVRVGDDAGATTHEVTVSAESLARYGAGPATDVQALVHESFLFLLEREARESILRRFELGQIERYFPEYRTEIARRLRTRP